MIMIPDGKLTTVTPLHKTVREETIDPTSYDLSLPDIYVPLFFAYRLADKSNVVYSQQLKRIKESLSKVLVSFYEFAGRWSAIPPGSGGRKLLCNDKGVPFIETYVDKDLDSVVQASTAFQPVLDLQGFEVLGMDAMKIKQEMQPDGLPSMFVRITRFACGGLVLAVTFNHMTTDGKGFFNFLTAWSDISRTDKTSVKVDHNRAQVDIPATRDVLTNLQSNQTCMSGDEPGGQDTAPTLSPWDMKVFEVSASKIQALKQEAKEGGGWVSTGDCITSHLWKSLAGLPSRLLREREVNFGFAVEGRTRFLDPPLPDLCGNVYRMIVGLDLIAFSDLLEMPLIAIARRIRYELQTKRREDWVSVEASTKEMQLMDIRKFATVLSTNWHSFPIYEMDFGFGRPFFFSGLNLKDQSVLGTLGLVYVGPAIPSSSSSVATVHIWSTPEVLQALEHNPHDSTIFLEH